MRGDQREEILLKQYICNSIYGYGLWNLDIEQEIPPRIPKSIELSTRISQIKRACL